jgi:peptidoglycan/xylan/chitin deacetylase (PgdA/CDA1 family)
VRSIAPVVTLVALLGCQPPRQGSPPAPRPRPAHQQRSVAITIDDLPVAEYGRYRDAAERQQTVRELTGIIARRKVPVTGFFIMSLHEKDPSLLPLWRRAGVRLGNHTWSHPHADKVSAEEYLADLERGHRAIAALADAPRSIPFRHPYLAEGFLPERRAAIRARLGQLGSRPAPVTIDTSDWFHARGYLEAKHAGDARRARLYRRAWRWDIEETTLVAELLARELFGREPPQILLLHGNALNADHLDEVLDWFERRGYRFVPLEQALADPAYALEDRSTAPTGDSHWLRLLRSRKLTGRWSRSAPGARPRPTPRSN